MKATIDIEDALYHRLKAEAARRGRTVRDLVAEGVRHVLGMPEAPAPIGREEAWFGVLGPYGHKQARHDLAAMRRSVSRAHTGKKPR